LKSIDTMVKEHENIKRMSKVMRKYCYKVLTCKEVDYEDFYKIIDFVRNYSDGHHHAKEEDVLFKRLGEEIPKLGNEGAITGMLIEHDLSRLYIANLEASLDDYKNGNDEARLDIIANAISYTDLLERHIEKENNALYKFANTMLTEKAKKEIDEKCNEIDKKAEEMGNITKYTSLLEELESKIK